MPVQIVSSPSPIRQSAVDLVTLLKSRAFHDKYGADYCQTAAAMLTILINSCSQLEAEEQLYREIEAVRKAILGAPDMWLCRVVAIGQVS